MLTEDLSVILKVAEHRSITAAATRLDMLPATASAAVKRVERALGVELFIRTTRSLRLSPAGERYIPQVEQALQMLDQARLKLQDDRDSIEGELRLAVSSDLGRNLVLPWLDEFTTAHPQVSLKLNVSDSVVDFYRDAVDMALRYGSPEEANLYGFKICKVPGLLCAAPTYLEKHGAPEHPHELAAHNGLFYQLHDLTHDVWSLSKNGQEFKVKMSGNRASNDGDLVRRWCVAGQGVAVKSCLDMADDLLAGRIVPLLPGYRAKQSELWLICPSRQLLTPATRLLRDMLKEKTRGILKQLVVTGLLEKSVLE